MSRIGLEFLPNPSGDGEGLSDAGIETFRDKPFAAVARETAQNSRDARDNTNEPVRLTFDIINVSSNEFPSIDEFREAARLCLEKSKKRNAEKEIGFFQQAVRALEQEEIRILRVSDFNTKGVRGPCQEGKPFHTLAKADGASDKDDIDSGGSFGIGKNAVFAISDVQTAFFSTRYADSQGEHVLCMGKTQFISHRGADGEEKRRKGYWGKTDGYMPLDDPQDIPEWLLREEQGTSIFSICMRAPRTDWRYEMVAAILMNFFCAIERREMEFEIDNGYLKVNRNTLKSLFQDDRVNQAVDQLNARAAFDAARTLHACLIDEQTTVHQLQIAELGTVTMRMLLRDGLGYTLGIVRNGMYITNNLANFGEQFLRFPLHRDFAVLVEPNGKIESEWFKRLENPRHDDLSAERITDPALREQGERAFAKLALAIRTKIRELAKTDPTSTMELDELNDFFASDESRTEDDDGPEIDPRSFNPTPIRPAPPRARLNVPRSGGEEIDVPGPAPTPDPIPDPPNPFPGPGPTPRPQQVVEPILLENERNLLPDAADSARRRLFFTSPVSGEVVVKIEATGLSVPEQIMVKQTDEGHVENGNLVVSCEAGKRTSVDVVFTSGYAGPIELTATCRTMSKEAAE